MQIRGSMGDLDLCSHPGQTSSSTLTEGPCTSTEHMRDRLVTGGAGNMPSPSGWQQSVQKPEACIPCKCPQLGHTLLLKPGQAILMAFSEFRTHCMSRKAAAVQTCYQGASALQKGSRKTQVEKVYLPSVNCIIAMQTLAHFLKRP